MVMKYTFMAKIKEDEVNKILQEAGKGLESTKKMVELGMHDMFNNLLMLIQKLWERLQELEKKENKTETKKKEG